MPSLKLCPDVKLERGRPSEPVGWGKTPADHSQRRSARTPSCLALPGRAAVGGEGRWGKVTGKGKGL